MRPALVLLSFVLLAAGPASVAAQVDLTAPNVPGSDQPPAAADGERGPRPRTTFLERREVVVRPLSGSSSVDDLHRFEDLGVLDVGGYTELRLAAAGTLTGSPSGPLELVLVPEAALVKELYRRKRVLLLEEVVTLRLEVIGGAFEAVADPATVRFPQYRAYIRNRTGQSVSLDLYFLLLER